MAAPEFIKPLLRVLVVDDERSVRNTITQQLTQNGFVAQAHESPFSALEALAGAGWDCVLTDICMPTLNGLKFFEEIKRSHPQVAVIFMTAYGDVKTAVRALHSGAADYLTKPFEFAELKMRLSRLAEQLNLGRELASLRATINDLVGEHRMVGDSSAMQETRALISRFARLPSNVLIVGETGTGKELVARALHAQSGQTDKPFVALNCGAVPSELAESELFGHEAGAFTGALKRHKGRVELAEGGTLFLDDVDDLPLNIQVKLLRVIQERTYERVGGEQPLTARFRLVSATKMDLQKLSAEKRFREDLYFRLAALMIPVPPLRERKEDLPLLAHYFLHILAKEQGRETKQLSAAALQNMQAYNWPGNVRELRHAMEYALAMSCGREIPAHDLPSSILGAARHKIYVINMEGCESVDARALLANFESDLIQWALRKAHGRHDKAATLLGYPRTTLLRKLKECQ
jgi:DNA-binding NtrC family response regulator